MIDGVNCPYVLPVKSEFKRLFFRRFFALSKRIKKKKKKKKIGQKNQLSKMNINKSKISSNFKGQLEIILSYFLKVCLHAN